MSDLKKYVKKRRETDLTFNQGYDEGFEQLLIGLKLREFRKEAGLTQEALAKKLGTKKSAISRIEKHTKDVKLSTLYFLAHAFGKEVKISFK